MNQTYFIPANYTDSGRLFGLFEIRNTIEAVVLGIPVLAFCMACLPLGLTAKMIVTISLFVPVSGFALIGIADDCLSRYLRVWITWRRRRKVVLTYRGEVDKHGFQRTYIRRRDEGRA